MRACVCVRGSLLGRSRCIMGEHKSSVLLILLALFSIEIIFFVTCVTGLPWLTIATLESSCHGKHNTCYSTGERLFGSDFKTSNIHKWFSIIFKKQFIKKFQEKTFLWVGRLRGNEQYFYFGLNASEHSKYA